MKPKIYTLRMTFASAFRSRRTTSILVVANLVWLALLVIGWSPKGAHPLLQKNQKSVLKFPGPKNEPVMITETKARGRKIKLGQWFEDEDDWLKHVTVSLKNHSQKAITFLEIDFDFPETKAKVGSTMVHQIRLGQRDDFPSTLKQPPLYLKPNETITISLDAAFTDIRTAVETAGTSLDSITKLVVRTSDIIFEDGSLFSNGMSFRRNSDPGSPQKWVRTADRQGNQNSN